MAELKCAYCYSTKVKIVASYENREVIVVQCLNCGKQSELDAENENTDPP
ncbi:MAG: hypothetical protein HYT88_00170 [Candidatus Omnitrophica bacterium]|nr:hypothetical protein [Candidatus Omnitrophota bacterium]MBI2174406.1 hypothetical protein [Candidatus Omnitrophota bacterium]MBI3010574.1 hypothetical protein [Candidatus Omnitrophota bacterium]